MSRYVGEDITFFPDKGAPRDGIVTKVAGVGKGKTGIILVGDPFPIVVQTLQIEGGKGKMPVSRKAPSPAKKLRQEARNLGVEGWEGMDLAELKAAVADAQKPKRKTPVPAARKVPREQAEKSARARKASKSRPATKKAASKPRKAATKPSAAPKRTPARKTAPKASKATRTAKRNGHASVVDVSNPFRPNSNLHLITEELLKGGKRSDMVKRLRRQIDIHPWSKEKEEDPDKALHKRVLLTANTLKNEYDFAVHLDGRGASGTIKVTPPGAKSKKAVAKKGRRKAN